MLICILDLKKEGPLSPSIPDQEEDQSPEQDKEIGSGTDLEGSVKDD